MFYEMLSGELPLGGEPLTALVKSLPREADKLVEKTIAHNPEDRYSSAKDFRIDLLRIYQRGTGEAIEILPVTEEDLADQALDESLPVLTAMQDNRNIIQRFYYRIKAKLFGTPTHFDSTFKKK